MSGKEYHRQYYLDNKVEFLRKSRAYHAAHRREARDRNLRKAYGIGIEDYERMLVEQGGRCAICDGPPTKKGVFYVDHDHLLNKVRGLLCSSCNFAIGLLKEKLILFERAVSYLNKWRETHVP